MKDFEGKEINIGDEVIFIYSNLTGGKKLMKGTVEKIANGCAYIKGMGYNIYDASPIDSPVMGVLGQVKVRNTSIYKI